MPKTRIHKEGRQIISVVLFFLFVVNIIIYLIFPQLVFAINLAISAILLMFFLYFFRIPRRSTNITDPNIIIAPADGKVVVIEPTEENEWFYDKRLQVSIFMSVLNVHANWYPIWGEVKHCVHHSGSHKVAYLPKSSTENERSTVIIEGENKTQILVRQIAGALARRIVTYAKPGIECHPNEQLGFIKFGSRVDIFLPLDTDIYVEMGDSTVGNQTIIGRLKTCDGKRKNDNVK